MIARVLACLAAVVLMGFVSLRADERTEKQSENAMVGDSVRIQLVGDLAIEFQKLLGAKERDLPPGLKISFDATIKRLLNDGRVVIEQSIPIEREGRPARLLTFEVETEFKLATSVIPKGAMIYASTGRNYDSTPTPTAADTRERVLVLSDKKGLKLRVWTIDKEFGDKS